ncbi:hypothetical protein SAMN06265827_105117 [Orenia metallireducens]|uniref:Uncharacterized protein n=1 Tax=Orenia metallireducens TaxID=1413210 RepID=A0A285G799_9FIRM|nr:hypothetical protein [Orenia metallireducens]SNY19417.1 hypothetical protein SAMN06265827_105117 [Orenia metallireducens]
MTYLDLISALRDIGLQVAYRQFKQPTEPPFAVVLENSSDDLMADNINYKKITDCSIEYYHDIKHPPTEESIEGKLKELGLTYSKRETDIEKEGMIQTVYDLQII